MRPSRKPPARRRPPLEPTHLAGVAFVIIAKEVQQTVQGKNTKFGGETVAAWRLATPSAITTSPNSPGSSAGNERTSVGVLPPMPPIQFANAGVETTATVTVLGPCRHHRLEPAGQPGGPHARRQHDINSESAGVLTTPGFGARRRVGVIGLDDVLHQLVPDDILVVEVDDADALDFADDLDGLHQPETGSADRSA